MKNIFFSTVVVSEFQRVYRRAVMLGAAFAVPVIMLANAASTQAATMQPPTNVKVSKTTTNSITLTWSRSPSANVGWYVIYRNGQSQYLNYVTGNVLTYTDSNLAANTTYSYQLTAVNASTQAASSKTVSVSGKTLALPNAPAMTVAFTEPAANATVSGTITMYASASSTVSAVAFYANDVLIRDDTTPNPFGAQLDTTTLTNGTLALKAVARNSAGQTVSAMMNVAVDNVTNPPVATKRCFVHLHGSTESGKATVQGDPVRIYPNGNAPLSPGRVWDYTTTTSKYGEMISGIKSTIPADCAKIVLYGFSNGGGAAAKIYCKGETFGGKLVGVIIDDPAMDHGTDNCLRPAGVQVVAYYTGGSTYGPGVNCLAANPNYPYCEGNELIGTAKFQSNVGVTLKRSIYTTHTSWQYPPEFTNWW